LSGKRIWEIDFLRALAIILMIVFHLVFDLSYFAGLKINYSSGFWYWEGKAAALLFIFLAGISSGFSRNTVKRGLKVLGFGLVITLVTFVVFREQYVRYGILHLLGTGMLLFPLLKRLPAVWLVLGAAVIAVAALPMRDILVETSIFLPLGLMYEGFSTVDYYPLVPYFAVFLLGIVAYKKFYYQRKSLFPFDPHEPRVGKYITLISKNSLAIYLFHQPVLLVIIYLIKWQ
jgi:uncharacterized membrane protein